MREVPLADASLPGPEGRRSELQSPWPQMISMPQPAMVCVGLAAASRSVRAVNDGRKLEDGGAKGS